jgi:predicted O-methyltransferase YrrM
MISLLNKYKGEFIEIGTDKNKEHCYGMLYEIILQKYKKTAKNILEIGIASGASLCVWEEYFINAKIYGIDINESNIKYGLDKKRIFMYKFDGTLPDTPIKLGAIKYDIIIDDASHNPIDQIKSLDIFAPFINDNGMYIIEDISERYADNLKIKLQEIADKYLLRMEWYDLRHINNQYDDIVAVFYKYVL